MRQEESSFLDREREEELSFSSVRGPLLYLHLMLRARAAIGITSGAGPTPWARK